jgi:hypothetical protein
MIKPICSTPATRAYHAAIQRRWKKNNAAQYLKIQLRCARKRKRLGVKRIKDLPKKDERS